MESILLLAIVGRGAHSHSLDDLRSPVIPFPPDPPPPELSASVRPRSNTPPLTERTLKQSHLEWLVRRRDLSARLDAVDEARRDGLSSCWAGDADDAHHRSLELARDEADWVEAKLREAVRWCRGRGVKKVSMKKVLRGAKNGCVVRSRPSSRERLDLRSGAHGAPNGSGRTGRPAHDSFPLVLLDLPFPLPVAHPSNVYTLTVPLPPAIDAERRTIDEERDAPPSYTVEADVGSGETSVERGADVVEYGQDGLTRLGSREGLGGTVPGPS
ncbi:hypothetical protein JCM10212_005799 [Sporobolomyces blumeae]